MEPKPVVFEFEFDFRGSVQLSVGQLWPDGDAPENPTIHDVIDLMIKCNIAYKYDDGRVRIDMSALLEDWSLVEDVDVVITGPGGRYENEEVRSR